MQYLLLLQLLPHLPLTLEVTFTHDHDHYIYRPGLAGPLDRLMELDSLAELEGLGVSVL